MARECGYKCQGATRGAFLLLVLCHWEDFPFRFWFVHSKAASDIFLSCFQVGEKLCPYIPCEILLSLSLLCLLPFLVSPWFLF